MTKDEALNELKQLIGEINGLCKVDRGSAEHIRWMLQTDELLTEACGAKSPHLTTFRAIPFRFIGKRVVDPYNFEDTMRRAHQEAYVEQLDTAKGVLEAAWHSIERKGVFARGSSGDATQLGTQIFLVHGRDEAAREGIARFLEKMQLPLTILHEKPNAGKTLIEKLEANSDVGFAVVLLTRDDVGGLRDTPIRDLNPRARQNVIFELGFFLGKIGRGRVCALYEEGVELPSDYDGVAFIPFDTSGYWRHALIRELHAAGFEVDANLLLTA